jgi:predicted acetyltransferase
MTQGEIRVRVGELADKPVLRQLLEFNAYEFSRFTDADLDEHGRFGYLYLDHYWTEPDRLPYLIIVGTSIAGLALVRTSSPHSMAEFLVMPKYRRAGVGTAAAREVLAALPGPWEIHELPGNEAAARFWRQAIPCPYTEKRDEHGTRQSFSMPYRAS